MCLRASRVQLRAIYQPLDLFLTARIVCPTVIFGRKSRVCETSHPIAIAMLGGVVRARAPCSARHRGCIAPSVRTVAGRRLHAVAAGEDAKASAQSMKDVSF